MEKYGFQTKALHAGLSDKEYKSLIFPIYQSVAYPYETSEDAALIHSFQKEGQIYGRMDNPTLEIFEKRLAVLEEGEACIGTSSGMSAIYMIAVYFARNGGEIVSSNRIYGGSYVLFSKMLPELGIKVHLVKDIHNIDEWESKINQNTKFLFIETPSNPSIDVLDIKRFSDLAHSHNISLIVDNTIATPALQIPIKFGADVIVHSATKYICGNSTSLAGAVIGRKEEIKKMREEIYEITGPTLSPFNAWLLLIGLETLYIRMQKHSENAKIVAEFLENHPKVDFVSYPFLKGHPQFDTAKKQMSGGSSLISFNIKGSLEDAYKFIDSVNLIKRVGHLGDSKTLITHPRTITHQSLTDEEREDANVSDNSIRISVGLEDVNDLIEDIEQSLGKI